MEIIAGVISSLCYIKFADSRVPLPFNDAHTAIWNSCIVQTGKSECKQTNSIFHIHKATFLNSNELRTNESHSESAQMKAEQKEKKNNCSFSHVCNNAFWLCVSPFKLLITNLIYSFWLT